MIREQVENLDFYNMKIQSCRTVFFKTFKCCFVLFSLDFDPRFTPWIIQFYNQSWARDNTTATTWPESCCWLFHYYYICCRFSIQTPRAELFSNFSCPWRLFTLSRCRICRCHRVKKLSHAQLCLQRIVKRRFVRIQVYVQYIVHCAVRWAKEIPNT